MQFSLTKWKLFLALGLLIGISAVSMFAANSSLFSSKNQSLILTSKLNKQSNIESWNPNRIEGKSMTPFRTNLSFEWLDEVRGIGKVRVEIEAKSFIEQTWSYQWILPADASSSELVSATFDSPQFRKTQVFEIEISGLDYNSNQNLFLKLKPTMRNDSAMTIVIPTRNELSTEGITHRSFAQNTKIQALRKNLFTHKYNNQFPKIQF